MADDVLTAIAAIGLRSSAQFPKGALSDTQLAGTLNEIERHHLTGLAALASAEGRLELTGDQLELIAERNLRAQTQTVIAEHDLLQVTAALERMQVPFRVLKGSAYAHRHWPAPELRPFVDFDLLVRSEDLDDVVAICNQLGATRLQPELRQGFDRRFAKGVTMRGPSGIEWDLHRTLSLGPFGFTFDLEALWNDPDEIVIAGRRLLTPPVHAEFVHSCLHVTTTGTARLLSLRDVVTLGQIADLPEAEALASACRATACVQVAVERAAYELRLARSQLTSWAADLHPTDDELQILREYVQADYSASALARIALRYVPGWRNKASYTAALVMPDRANRHARGRNVLDQLRGVLRGLQ